MLFVNGFLRFLQRFRHDQDDVVARHFRDGRRRNTIVYRGEEHGAVPALQPELLPALAQGGFQRQDQSFRAARVAECGDVRQNEIRATAAENHLFLMVDSPIQAAA